MSDGWTEQQVQDWLVTAHAIAEHWTHSPDRSWPEEKAALTEEWSEHWAQAWPASGLLERFDAGQAAPDTAYAIAYADVADFGSTHQVTEQQYEDYLDQGEHALTFDPATLMVETVDEAELSAAVESGLLRFDPIEDDSLETI